MGFYYAKDRDGFYQEFTIKGDQPSQTEMSRISAFLSGQPVHQQPKKEEEQETGILGNFGRGVTRSVDNFQSGLYTSLEGLAHGTGGSFLGRTEEDYRKLADEQRAERDETQLDVDEGGFLDQKGAYKKLKYLAGVGGESATDMVAGLGGVVAGTVAGTAIGGALGGPAGAIAGGAIGGTLVGTIPYTPSMLNENVEAQIQEHGRVKDWGKAVGSALANAAIESTTDKLTLGVAGVFKKPASALFKKEVKNAVDGALTIAAKKIGATAAVSTLSGSMEEVLQSISTRWQAEQNLMDEDAKKDYIESAIVGGILEGAFGIGVGSYGAVKEAKNEHAANAAIHDAEEEGLNTRQSLETNAPLYENKREGSPNKPTPAGLLEDRTIIQAPQHLVSEPFGKEDKSPVSEEEYSSAINAIRGEKKVALDKLQKKLNIDRPKAKILFDEMLRRGDAQPTGSASQYLRLKPRREYLVKPIEEQDAAPYKVSYKGKEIGEAFRTEEEAIEWSKRAGIKKFDVIKVPPKAYGVYEVQSEIDPKTGEKKLIGKRPVKSFSTSKEANEAVREYDPNFSAETNEKQSRLDEEERQARINENAKQELGKIQPALQNLADALVGKNRTSVNLAPVINNAYLRSLGIKDANIPEGSVVEGMTLPSLPDAKKAVRQVIGLANDLNSPSLTEAQKLQKLNEVLTHEIVHVMRNLDLLKKSEWDALTKYAVEQKVPGKPYTYMQWAAARNPGLVKEGNVGKVVEEGIAEMLRAHQKNPTILSNPHRSLVQKLGDFIRKLLRLGAKYRGDDVMNAIFGGEVAARKPGVGGLGFRNYPGDPFYSNIKVPGFYMKSDRFFSNLKQDKAPKDQWLGILNNSGIKKEELDWLGLEDFIREVADVNPDDAIEYLSEKKNLSPRALQDDYGFANRRDYIEVAKAEGWEPKRSNMVRRGDILDYIRANAIDIEEMKSWVEGPSPWQDELMTKWSETNDPDFNTWILEKRYDPSLEPLVQSHQKYFKQYDGLLGDQPGFSPRHKGTTQPNGENYREFLFILPRMEPEFTHWHWAGMRNVLVHARVSTRDINGKKTLFIEEIQSDLHQQGSKEGYITKEYYEKLNAVEDKIEKLQMRVDLAQERWNQASDYAHDGFRRDAIKRANDLGLTTGDDQFYVMLDEAKDIANRRAAVVEEEWFSANDDLAAAQEQYDRLRANAVPDAPLKGTWEELAFKRMVKYAIDAGYDQIAWHGSPESVAASEHWGTTFIKSKNEKGEPRYYIGDPDYENTWADVTGVVNTYLHRLKNFASKTFKKFNTGPVFVPRSQEVARPPLNVFFESKYDWHSFVAHYGDGLRQFGDIRRLSQIIENQRNFDVNDAFDRMDFPKEPVYEILDAIGEVNPDGFDRWVLPLSDELKESVTNDGQPIFSMTDDRKRSLMEDPNFKKWFKKSKVVGPDGLPLVVYHGTRADRNFDSFYVLSHFGTANAANDRMDAVGEPEGMMEKIADAYNVAKADMITWWVGLPQSKRQDLIRQYSFSGTVTNRHKNMRVYPAFLSIQNPLNIVDDGILESLDDYKGAVLDALQGDIEWNPKAYLARKPLIDRIVRATNTLSLIKPLEEAGYDGFKYINQAEDIGSTSWVIFRPPQVKSIFNRGTWSPRDRRIDYSATVPQYAATAPMGQRVPANPPADLLADVEAKITYNNLVPHLQKLERFLPVSSIGKAKYRNAVEGTFISLQDRMLSVGKLIDRIKANGGFISNESDTYLQEQLFSGQTDAKLQDNTKDYYEPLAKAIKNLHVTAADKEEAGRLNSRSKMIVDEYRDPKKALTELYLYAQHAIERNAEMRKRNENLQEEREEQYEYGSGMADGEAQQILDWFMLKPFGRSFYDLNNPTSIRTLFRKLIANTNDIRVAGDLNPDFRTMVDKEGNPVDVYKDYAPLRNWVAEHADPDEEVLAFARAGKGYNIQGKEDYSATGRSSLASNIIASAILQNEEAIIRAGKNMVGKSFLKLIQDNAADTDINDFAEVIQRKPRKATYDRKTGKVRMVADNSMWNDPSILKVKLGGEQVYIKIKDERLARALNSKSSIGNIGTGPITKAMLSLNRWLAMTRTSLNPEFMVSNMLRDLQAALVNVSELEMKGMRRQIMKDVLPALNGVRHALRTGDMTTEWSKTFHEFRKMGGMTAFYGIRDLNNTIERVSELLKDDYSGADPRKVLKALKGVGKLIEHYNLAIENGTRLAAYKNARDKFLSMTSDPRDPANIKRAQEQAARLAKNLTVNFNMGGDLKPVMNAWYLFFNAGIQGSMALINPMIRSKKVRKIWAGVLLAGLMQDILMSMISPEDDDGKKVYDKLDDYILEHNLVLMDPFGLSERGYFKIPLPYVMNGIYNAGRALGRLGRGESTPWKTFNSVGGTLVDSLNPWGGTNSVLNFIAPTVVDPIVDLYQNENFANQPISPPENPFGINEKASQRYWNNTSPGYVTVADWLSRLTGSEGDYLPGKIEVSPNQLQYMLEWVFGGVGTFVQRTGDLVAGKNVLEQMITGGDWSANDIPIVRRAYGNVTSKNDLQAYIAGRDDVLRVRAELKDALKDGDTERYQRIMTNHKDEYRVAVTINKIENARKKYSSRIKKIRESKAIPDEKKQEAIKTLKERQDALVGRANKILAQLR